MGKLLKVAHLTVYPVLIQTLESCQMTRWSIFFHGFVVEILTIRIGVLSYFTFRAI